MLHILKDLAIMSGLIASGAYMCIYRQNQIRTSLHEMVHFDEVCTCMHACNSNLCKVAGTYISLVGDLTWASG